MAGIAPAQSSIMRRSITCLSAVLGLGVGLCARAGVIDAPGGDLEVSLITYGPGAIYWERFASLTVAGATNRWL